MMFMLRSPWFPADFTLLRVIDLARSAGRPLMRAASCAAMLALTGRFAVDCTYVT
jgi:hypothetical protein